MIVRSNNLVTMATDKVASGAAHIVATHVSNRGLRICNAYASKHPLNVYHLPHKHDLTGNDPLAYKQCRDFVLPLSEGDDLQFKAGGVDVGEFKAEGLPSSTTPLLLLVPHLHHDGASKRMTFTSHMFQHSDHDASQVVIIDASYKGSNPGGIQIFDKHTLKGSSLLPKDLRREQLAFNSMSSVSPGRYEVAMDMPDWDLNAARSEFNVGPDTNYVVMRVGDTGKSGAFPEELVVFPQMSASFHKSLSGAIILITASLLLLSS